MIPLLAACTVLLLLGDPYAWQMSYGDLILVADGVWWQSIVAAVDLALLVGTGVAYLAGRERVAYVLLLLDVSAFLLANVTYVARDGLDRFSGGLVPGYVPLVVFLGLVVRLTLLGLVSSAMRVSEATR